MPKSKIKEKIEELNKQDKEWTDELSEPDCDFKNIDMNLKRIKNQIDILQELESEEEQFMKNKVVILTVFILIIVVVLRIFRTKIFNKQLVDFTFSYDKCITTVGNKVYEIEIDSWKDYADGEQLQIKAKDGTIYLVSANNSILIKEKK